MYLLCGQAARGLVVVGSARGRINLVDPRADFRPQHAIAAHGAGLSDLDARGDLLATCGFAMRHGQVATENYVKVREERCQPTLRHKGFEYARRPIQSDNKLALASSK